MRFEGHFDFERIERALADSRPKGLVRSAEHVRDISSELAPKETGDLAGSADVHMTGKGQVEITYPGPYARYQEYGVFWRMRPRPSPSNGKPLRHDNGQSFFLTTPMKTEKERCLQIMADTFKEAMQ